MSTRTATPTGAPPSAAPPTRALTRRNLAATLAADYLPLALAVLVVVIPLAYLVLSSFKSPGDLLTRDLVVFPHPFRVENYSDAASSVPFPRLFLNSLIVTVFGAGIKVVLAIFTAYAVVFVEFPGRKYVFWAVLATLMVPPQVTMLPNYVLITSMGGADTYWGIILPGLATGFGTFLLRQAFLSLPVEVIEAAQIDGAGTGNACGRWWSRWPHPPSPRSRWSASSSSGTTTCGRWSSCPSRR